MPAKLTGQWNALPELSDANDGYLLTASYGDVDPITMPAADMLRPTALRGIDYPTPGRTSCAFRP